MAVEVKFPSVGESVQEGEVYKWHKQSGDQVAVDDVLVEIETDKATVEIVAESSGILTTIAKQGDVVKVGEVLAKIDTSSVPATTKPPKPAEPSSAAMEPVLDKDVRSTNLAKTGTEKIASPAANRIISEKQLDKNAIEGTGKAGRITKEDVLTMTSGKGQPQPSVAVDAPAIAPKQPGDRGVRREKMSRIRKTIATRLVTAQHEAAMLTTFNEVDMTEIMALRSRYKDGFKERFGVNLGFMSFFVQASVRALLDFPRVNAYIINDEIEYHDFCDIGIAVSTEKGLLVPILRNCETLDFAGIESTIVAFANKGRAGKISPDELSGGTFTITNGGVFGSLLSTPILSPPQSAILGMHKIQERPMAIRGQVVVRPMMYLALTYDHRIVDGKEAVGFLVKIKDLLEDPSRLLLGV